MVVICDNSCATSGFDNVTRCAHFTYKYARSGVMLGRFSLENEMKLKGK